MSALPAFCELAGSAKAQDCDDRVAATSSQHKRDTRVFSRSRFELREPICFREIAAFAMV
jgi:hypothetical protein